MKLCGKIWESQRGHRWQYNATILFAFRVTNATNTRSGYVMLTAFPRQKWLREHTSNLCYTYMKCLIKSCVLISEFALGISPVCIMNKN